MIKICNFCGNKNSNKTVAQYIYRNNGRFMIVDDVPCEQCEYCGEQYFAADVLKKIEEDFTAVYSHKKKATQEIVIPVEQFAFA
ncbi:MAG: YgiT-type zinc finger domain-containing protein [Thermoplasmata archaeon]|nr:MAG: YgiT-type zinc finger domain-containing protein [Thermoplasmata archaeon]